MKRMIAFTAFLFCLLLVIFARPSMQAAQTALALWWGTLLPTLFPFFASATLMERTGALHMLANRLYPISEKLHISHYALPVMLLGGMTGYPSGARLCGILQSEGCIGDEEAERLGTVCNLSSPMFLVGVVATGMFGNMQVVGPLAAGHYGGALLVAAALQLILPVRAGTPKNMRKQAGEPLYRALPATIASGMGDMLKVGGTVMFFLVLAELMQQVGIFRILGIPLDMILPAGTGAVRPSQGVLLGLLEMTGGCHTVLQAGLPLRSAAALCSFLISFGGLSVFVQAMAFVEFKKPLRYLCIKFMHGVLSACITFFMISRKAGAVEVFSPSSSAYAVNAISSLTVLFACALGIAAAMLLAMLCGKKNRSH